MQKNGIEAVIFDMDETLYSEKDFVESGFRVVAGHIEEKFSVGREYFFDLLVGLLEKDGRGRIFDAALEKCGLAEKEPAIELVEIYRRHNPDIGLFPEAVSLLKALKKNRGLAVITDGLGYVQRNKAQALGINDLFDLVIYTDDYKKPKPDIFSFEKALSHFGVSSGQAVYIGDDPYKDFIGPKKIGMRTIRVLQGRLKNVEVGKEIDADFTVRSIAEVGDLLKKF